MENLHTAGVDMHTDAKCVEITPEGPIVEREGKTEVIACDAVVVAVGAARSSQDEQEQACKDLGIEYYTIGDAKKPRRALDATAEGAKLARSI
jgi:uncharacterized FAD-dependent dehydrogenase